jgi:FkbH-like protein
LRCSLHISFAPDGGANETTAGADADFARAPRLRYAGRRSLKAFVMPPPTLDWLPASAPDLGAALRGLTEPGAASWAALVGHANTGLDGMGVLQVDRTLRRLFGAAPPPDLVTAPVRLAVLGSSTLDHLLPSLRVGALRHGLWLQARTGEYGQLSLEPGDDAPGAVLLALDARTATAGFDPGLDGPAAEAAMDAACNRIVALWREARARGCSVLHQAALPIFAPQFGNNEHRLPGSRSAAVQTLNARLRVLADAEGVDIVAIDQRAARDGIGAWHDPMLWHRAKQEVHPGAGPIYGDLVARLLAARQGRSRKALVLDLDNTLWGGVIGDDGMEGIVIGQGSALGEAYLDMQDYARGLTRRGVILAVCSKNDEANALEPFEKHPDMVLRRGDIACFVANWNDKAANLREIARRLNIGIDSLVFADDNPAERAIIRRELPEVAVPELPEDPALYAAMIAEAGYFEGVALTAEDRERAAQYQANLARAAAAPVSETDMAGYLDSLEMVLQWGRVDGVSAPRVVQLVNKTNQFNLTTRRTTDEAVAAIMADAGALSLQIRLIDKFGNNGIIAVVLGERRGDDMHITDWLMSCRVLKRGVEAATLNLVAAEARRLGALRLTGAYRPTAKNGMVRDHYASLGFAAMDADADGATHWALDLAGFRPHAVHMRFEPPFPPVFAQPADIETVP